MAQNKYFRIISTKFVNVWGRKRSRERRDRDNERQKKKERKEWGVNIPLNHFGQLLWNFNWLVLRGSINCPITSENAAKNKETSDI